jgi:hypothetical protein
LSKSKAKRSTRKTLKNGPKGQGIRRRGTGDILRTLKMVLEVLQSWWGEGRSKEGDEIAD